MALVKVVKNKAYFKRFQVKFRRRREGKTDYFARKRLIVQQKNKYGTKKYRLVARFSNKDIIAQIVYSTIKGDKIVSSAYSHELKEFGLNVGLTNYSAAYCTGLLLARRLLTKFKLNDLYLGQEDVTGDVVMQPAVADKAHPFKCILDVGLARTVTGARIFGVMKGATDGGLLIPHSCKRFPGATDDDFNPEDHRDKIFGKHVAEYMEVLKDEDEEKFKKHFSRYLKAGITPDKVEEMYESVHAAIRADPNKSIGEKQKKKQKGKRFNEKKISLEERRAKIQKKKGEMQQLLDAM
ncbi:hypothetical protein SNEBB_005394 [Seison nebaliae]|nr:hypothetical protein SNEBB_005394 [Seison nebaliae]